MDDYAEENHIDRVDFIKCDVEVSELFVYEGGRKLIAKSRPVIIFINASEMVGKVWLSSE